MIAMKKRFVVLMLGVIALCSTVLTGCVDDYGYWNPEPPYGWNNTFFDSRLDGYWELVQINGYNVPRSETNCLYFGGNGRGRYYYLRGGGWYEERTAYWCQESVNGATYYQINLQYEDGEISTMNYWFTDRGDTLWMQWRNSQGLQTYVYAYSSNFQW